MSRRFVRRPRSPRGRTWCILTVLLAAAHLIGGCAGIRIERRYQQRSFDWLTFAGTPERTNESRCVISPPLKPVWEYNALAGISGSPLVKDSIVLVGTLRGELHAFKLGDGQEIGYTTLESAVAGTPVWDGIYAYVACASGTETVARISLLAGKRDWSARCGAIESSPLLMGDSLYLTTLEGLLLCLKKSDGLELWRFETGERETRKPIRSSPASDGQLIVFGSDDGRVYAVERSSGKLRWKYDAGAAIFASPILKDSLCVIGSLDGILYALATGSGELRWKFDTQSRIFASAAVSKDIVVIGTTNGNVTAVSLESGKHLWTFTAQSGVSSAPLISGETVYIGSFDRNLYALRLRTGEKLWEYQMEGRIRVTPVLWGDYLLVTSEDKYITAFRPAHKE